MGSMAQRLRTFLREIGPGGVRAGAALLLLVVALLALSLVMIWYGLLAGGRQAAEQDANGEQYTIISGAQPEDFPLIFGSGASSETGEPVSVDARPREIPGLSEMDVIGYLQYIPGTNFRCFGVGPAQGDSIRRTCSSSSEKSAAIYEVTLTEDDPTTVSSVEVIARDAPDEEAVEVLGDVARLAVGALGPLDAEAWVKRSIFSGGQYRAEGVEVRLYGTEGARTLEIVGTAPTMVESPETTVRSMETTEPGSRQTRR